MAQTEGIDNEALSYWSFYFSTVFKSVRTISVQHSQMFNSYVRLLAALTGEVSMWSKDFEINL